MGIVIMRQPEMTDIVRRIFGARHGAQQHGIDEVLIRPPLRHPQYSRVIPARRFAATAQTQPQFIQKFLQIRDLVCRRRGMHPIQRRHLVALQVTRCSHIGRHHAFLDHLVRIVTYQRHNLFYLAVRTKDNTGFGGFKINGTTFGTRLAQHLVESIQLFQMRHQWLAAFASFRVVINHDRGRFIIGQPCMRAHQAVHETRTHHFAVFVEEHLASHAQAVDIRVQ